MDDDVEFDAEWDHSLFTASIPVVKQSSFSGEDWEARYNEDTAGYVSNSATTSFTDMDLGPALTRLGRTSEWTELDSWLDS
ncbi:MAG TPA: hypothetical protein VHZ98_14865 [Galbitalea sp.]|jgi:hypothetical protein|nr:hypothetical protein [Galbitalea sp.]